MLPRRRHPLINETYGIPRCAEDEIRVGLSDTKKRFKYGLNPETFGIPSLVEAQLFAAPPLLHSPTQTPPTR